MYIKHLELENFTVLHELNMDFSRGINVFIGENGIKPFTVRVRPSSRMFPFRRSWCVSFALTVLAFIACSVVRIAVGVHVSR